ncbi:uncharacterized protein LOC105164962 isoform X2 [Sesamum indicum]|nr:uncharacterized protein LOC105164962 isoform X2 [Sesamum indicum]
MSTLGLLDGGCINGAGFLADLTDRDLSRDLRSFAVVAQRTTKIKHLSPFVHKKINILRKASKPWFKRRKTLFEYFGWNDWGSYCIISESLLSVTTQTSKPRQVL